MDLSVDLTYDATPQRVAAMLLDPDFQRRLCEATGDPAADVSVSGEETRTSRRLPTDGFPDAMKRLVGDSVTAVQTTSWQPAAADGTRSGSVTVVIEGTPVRLDAEAHIGGGATGTSVRYAGRIRAKVPLVGGKIEQAAAKVVRRALQTEERVGRDWLAEHA